jgi:hypothetical protein
MTVAALLVPGQEGKEVTSAKDDRLFVNNIFLVDMQTDTLSQLYLINSHCTKDVYIVMDVYKIELAVWDIL